MTRRWTVTGRRGRARLCGWIFPCGIGVADKTSGVDVREDDREQAVSSFSQVIFFDEAEHDEKNVFGKQNPQ